MFPKFQIGNIVNYQCISYKIVDITTCGDNFKYDLQEVNGDGELIDVREVDIVYSYMKKSIMNFNDYLDILYEHNAFTIDDPDHKKMENFMDELMYLFGR